MMKQLKDKIPQSLLIKLLAGIIIVSLFFIGHRLHVWYSKPDPAKMTDSLKKVHHQHLE